MPNCQKQPPSGSKSRFEMKLSECFEPLPITNNKTIYRVRSEVTIGFKKFFILPENVINFEIVFYGSESYGTFVTHTDDGGFVETVKNCNFWETKNTFGCYEDCTVFRYFGELFLQAKQVYNFKMLALIY
jgi:hypothetical protein